MLEPGGCALRMYSSAEKYPVLVPGYFFEQGLPAARGLIQEPRRTGRRLHASQPDFDLSFNHFRFKLNCVGSYLLG